MKGESVLLSYNKSTYNGATGVSGALYKYIININPSDTTDNIKLKTNHEVITHYSSIKNYDELFNNQSFRNAIYSEYAIQNKSKPDKLKLIHAIGYNYIGKSKSDNKNLILIKKFRNS